MVGPLAQDLLRQAGQDVLRADLDEQSGAGPMHRFDLLAEAHRLDQVLGENRRDHLRVARVGSGGRVGEHLGLRRAERHLRQDRRQPIARRRDHRRMEGAGHRQQTSLDAVLLESLNGLLDAGARPGDHGLPRGVEVGDPDVLDRPQDLHDDLRGLRYRRHRPEVVPGRLQDAAPARLREAGQGVRVEHRRGAQGDVLAIAVAGDHVGPQAEATQQAQHRQTRRPQRRLGEVRLGQVVPARALVLRRERRRGEDAPAERRGKPAGERGIGTLELAAHLGKNPNRSSTSIAGGEQEGDAPATSERRLREVDTRGVEDRRGPGAQTLERSVDLLLEVVGGGGDDGERQLGAGPLGRASPQGKGEVGRLRTGAALEGRLETAQVVLDLRPGAPAPQEQLGGRTPGERRSIGHDLVGVLLQHGVEVRAAEAECRDAGAPRVSCGRSQPGAQLAVHVEGAVVETRPGVRLLDVQRRRQDLVVQRQGDLGHSRDTGGALGVTDHRLDRADGARLPRRACGLEHPLERRHLRLVPGDGAGAVRFDQPDAGG